MENQIWDRCLRASQSDYYHLNWSFVVTGLFGIPNLGSFSARFPKRSLSSELVTWSLLVCSENRIWDLRVPFIHHFHVNLVLGCTHRLFFLFRKPNRGSSSERFPGHYAAIFILDLVQFAIWKANSGIFVCTLRKPFSSEFGAWLHTFSGVICLGNQAWVCRLLGLW